MSEQPRKRKSYRKYTVMERKDALAILAANHGDVRRTSQQLAIPERTLRSWRRKYGGAEMTMLTEEAIANMKPEEEFRRLRQNIMVSMLRLTEQLKVDPYNAYEQALAVTRLLDKIVTLDAMFHTENTERVIRMEYVYPDGSVHDIPPVEALDFHFWMQKMPETIPPEYYETAFPQYFKKNIHDEYTVTTPEADRIRAACEVATRIWNPQPTDHESNS